jgi:ribose 5-phosphate isomerase
MCKLRYYFNSFLKLDVAFDGADEVDESLNLIKGGG